MPPTTAAEKSALRTQLRGVLKALPPALRQAEDEALFARFLALPQVMEARTILLYHGMGAEPDTARLIATLLSAGKRVCLPRCLPGNEMQARLIQADTVLVRHPYGMLEPGTQCPIAEPSEIDLVLVPGLAFDRSGGRLGQGGGFYDRWLSGYSGISVALCRACALFEKLPRETHDLGVDLVITVEGVYGPSAPQTPKRRG